MRRFLSQATVTRRMVVVLALAVVVPGLVLAWYGAQAVMQEETLYQATLRTRAEATAAHLFADLGHRMDDLLSRLDDAASEDSELWATDPARAARLLEDAEPLVAGVLVLDAAGTLRFPASAAHAPLGVTDRAHVEPFIATARRLELIEGRPTEAAEAYRQALDQVPGRRGQAIVLNAMARSLLKADQLDAALKVYNEIRAEHEGDLDFNDFPLDLLATYQGAVILHDLGRPQEAATRLAHLLQTLVRRTWTYGGHGELALARRAVEMLGSDGLLRQLPANTRPDLGLIRRRVQERAERQADEVVLLGLVPSLGAQNSPLDSQGGGFRLEALRVGDRALLLAHRWRTHGQQRRQIVVQLDDRSLRKQLQSSLVTATRANPEFRNALERSSPALAEPSQGIRVVRSLEPWLPGYSLVIESSEEGLFGAERRRQRTVRVMLIGGLLLIIAMGMVFIVRAVSREMEMARLKSDFVSNVSHELRTPLTTIRIMAEMLSLGAVPSDDKKQEYYRNIVSESERLSRLINNVLDFARIEDGRKKFKFGMGDVADVVYEVESITGDYIRAEGFTLCTEVQDDMEPTNFDRDALVQALINMMSNAVKYSEDDKHIELGARQDGEQILLWVTDRGRGIDPRDLPHLFEKFYRAGDHMTREVRGAGLGLSIVQHIVSAHGGTVEVRSKPGEGTTFELVLPVQQGANG